MKKISYFNPLNDINSETSKKSYKQIMKDHNCKNTGCFSCCFRNKSIKGDFRECLVSAIGIIKYSEDPNYDITLDNKENNFVSALAYYKHFYMKEIKQEEFDI